MKIKDMQAAMESGALVSVGKYSAKPATIIALRQPRKVYSGARWDFGGHRANDGVTVRFADGTENTVGPREVLGLHTDVQAEKAAKREADERFEQALNAQKVTCERAVAKLGMGTVSAKVNTYRGWRVTGYEVKLTPDQAKTLAARIA